MSTSEPNGERLTVGVIFGGRSVEHDVSVVTAHQVMSVLAARHDVVPIYITREGKWLSSPALNDLGVYKRGAWEEVADEAFIPPTAGYGGLQVAGGRLRGPRRVALDVVIPAVHGTYGEDGTLQGLLELADIPYAGSGVTASAAGMDKIVMKDIFAAAGLPLVRHVAFDTSRLDEDLEGVVGRIEREIGYPAFVKPARLGSSVGIGRASDRDELTKALEVARRYDQRVIVEVGMQGCIEVNCSVLGGPGLDPTASVCEQPVPWQEFLTFSDKYLRGSKGSKTAGMASQERRIPAPISSELTERVQANAIAAFTAINAAGVARVDSFVRPDTGETWIMEINTVPGSFSFYLWEATGVGFDTLMEKLIGSARAAHARKKELMFSYDSGMLQASAFGGKSG